MCPLSSVAVLFLFISFFLFIADILDFSRHGESWLYTTNFITDRLRQVRKETMQQEIKDITKVYILERIIRYHILLMYNNREYDVALNTSLFQTYLCDLLDVYSDYTEYPNFHEFRSYYLLNNISDSHLVYKELCNYYTFPNETYHSCIELATVFHTNNLYRFMRILAEKLTFLQACILINSLNNTRLSFLQMINKAFGLKFPISSLMKWLLFEKKADLITLLELLSIKFDSDFVYFSKEKTLSIDKLEMEKCTQNFSFSHILNMKFGDLTPSAISNGGVEFEK